LSEQQFIHVAAESDRFARRAKAAAAAADGIKGTDAGGTVTVTLDDSGRVHAVDVRAGWRNRVAAGELGGAVCAAAQSAASARLRAWAEAFTGDAPTKGSTASLSDERGGGFAGQGACTARHGLAAAQGRAREPGSPVRGGAGKAGPSSRSGARRAGPSEPSEARKEHPPERSKARKADPSSWSEARKAGPSSRGGARKADPSSRSEARKAGPAEPGEARKAGSSVRGGARASGFGVASDDLDRASVAQELRRLTSDRRMTGEDTTVALLELLHLVEDLERGIDEVTERLPAVEAAVYIGRSADRHVTVAVTGAGEVTEVRFDHSWLARAHEINIGRQVASAFAAAYTAAARHGIDQIIAASSLGEVQRAVRDPLDLAYRLRLAD
jgi:DNA-binding protein YbaB